MITKEYFLTHFFQLLNQRHIKYFVYGEYESLPQSTGNSDLDMVVENSDLDNLRKILFEIIKECNVSLVSYYSNTQTLFYRLLYCNEYKYWGLQLDVFFKGFYHQGSPYYPIKKIQSDIIIYHDINVLHLRKGYYIGFLKEIIHTGKAKNKYISGFLKELTENEEYYKQELTQLYGEHFCNLIFRNRTQEGLKKVFSELHKQMLYSVHRTKKFIRIKDRLLVFLRFFHKKPGYVIVILGTDGSGKSTIIDAITPVLNETFHNGIIYEHLRPNALPDIGVLLGKKEKQKGMVTDPHAQKQSKLFVSLLRWGYYMMDYTFGYLKKVFPVIHLKSKVFLFDRYYYDYYIDQKRSRTNLPRWIIRIGDIFIPNPDLILCLGGDPDIIYNRKPETSLEEVYRQINELKSFCYKRKNAVWIDTSVSIQETIYHTMFAINTMLSERFNTVIK
jgi:thymidylate kinase